MLRWTAITRDGRAIERWNADGTENRPDPWHTCQFHAAGDLAASLYVPKGAQFRYERRHGAVVWIAGWAWPDDNHGCFLYALADGRVILHHEATWRP